MWATSNASQPMPNPSSRDLRSNGRVEVHRDLAVVGPVTFQARSNDQLYQSSIMTREQLKGQKTAHFREDMKRMADEDIGLIPKGDPRASRDASSVDSSTTAGALSTLSASGTSSAAHNDSTAPNSAKGSPSSGGPGVSQKVVSLLPPLDQLGPGVGK
ncbi:uncharacterized protein J7T54_006812 [Emericellopsis cladophorae]|uniref:Uncharacterized protein n=1 Tax=Emericellopsis cladophorae TaxID=2686198 RepID=A0A9P9Y8D2_9HYPO|nr:uncharacterized protein J7T54_006812 [Emericellopsis cladophorae]KAI6785170.1 hypothetical protein J7T54_006812 [Emericellopsis cladophorae]